MIKLKKLLINFKLMVLNQVKTGKNAKKRKNVNPLKNSRKKFGKNRKKL